MIQEHGTYFMKQDLYTLAQSEAVRESPLNALSPEEWLDVLHHINAHEVEGPRSAGYAASVLGDNTDRFFLYQMARDYVDENNGGALVPQSERGLFEKVTRMLSEIEFTHEWADVSAEGRATVWDIRPKAA